jgi:hypothetical protein
VNRLRVVAGRDYDEALSSKQRQRRVLKWLSAADAKRVAGVIRLVDCAVARALENFPSANQGYCFAGQDTLGKRVGRSGRRVRESLKRLCDAGLLDSRRRGPGRTAIWTFCIDGVPLFERQPGPLKDRTKCAQDRTFSSGLDRTISSAKPYLDEPIQVEPPPRPPTGDEPDQMPDDVDTATTEDVEAPQGGLIGEVFAPSGCDFETFWQASGQRGKVGPAIAEWNRLEPADIAAIGALILDQGSVDTGDCWASIWIKSRGWERPALALRAGGFARIAEGLEGLDPYPLGMTIIRGTPQWDDLVAWRREQGATERDLKFMLTQAEWRAPPGWRPTR